MGAGRPMTSAQMKDSLEARARLLVKGAPRSIIVPPLRHPLDEAGDENRNPHTGPEKNLGRDLFAPSVSTPVFSGRPQLLRARVWRSPSITARARPRRLAGTLSLPLLTRRLLSSLPLEQGEPGLLAQPDDERRHDPSRAPIPRRAHLRFSQSAAVR